MENLKVGFLSSHNYLDRHTFSGTLYSMYYALECENLEIVNLGWPNRQSRYIRKLMKILGIRENSPLKVKLSNYESEGLRFNTRVTEQLKQKPCDIVFAPIAAAELAVLDLKVPVVYSSDSTLKQRYVEYQMDLTQQEFNEYNKREQAAISNAQTLVYSSDWAAQSAIADYSADPDSVFIVDYGANLEDIPAVESIYSRCKNTTCKLLFIGRDWERKGGELAFQVLISLLEMNINAELYVIGCTPPSHVKHSNLIVIPFLDKKKSKQRQQFYDIFLQSNYFLFPTRADCSPIVTCEACGFGLPILSTNVGGLPTLIENGKNGFMLSLSSPANEYANLIAQSFTDKMRYRQLVESTRNEYDSRLNWKVWAIKMKDIFSKTVASSRQYSGSQVNNFL